MSLDRTLRLLSDKRRRHIIYHLDERDGPVSIEELTTHVAPHTETPSTTDSSDHQRRLETELYHKHLPKLADEEFIQYDQDEGHIELTHLPPDATAIVNVTKGLDHP